MDFTVRRMSASAHITLCAVDFTGYQPISHFLPWFLQWDVSWYQSISHYETYIGFILYHTLCSGFHYETYIGISPYNTFCRDFYSETYIGISPYHTLCCGFNYETYIGISPYNTLCGGFHVFELQYISVMSRVTWLCEKMQMLFFFVRYRQIQNKFPLIPIYICLRFIKLSLFYFIARQTLEIQCSGYNFTKNSRLSGMFWKMVFAKIRLQSLIFVFS